MTPEDAYCAAIATFRYVWQKLAHAEIDLRELVVEIDKYGLGDTLTGAEIQHRRELESFHKNLQTRIAKLSAEKNVCIDHVRSSHAALKLERSA